MKFEKEQFSEWEESSKTLITRLSGDVGMDDVMRWIRGFQLAAEHIPANTKFKLFSNLHGFKAENMEAHKAMRSVIPKFLESNGMSPGYAKLFPEEPLNVTSRDGRVCIVCAHVHHDESKINKYHSELQTEYEDFFTDPVKARKWLNEIKF